MDELLQQLRNFLAAPEKNYLLCRDDAALIVAELERYRPIPLKTFADIKREARNNPNLDG